jgi:hypothetical protein
MKRLLVVVAIISLSFVAANMAEAYTVVDLTYEGAEGTINSAIFQQLNYTNAGTGNLDPFVRIQKTNTEQGYNTDDRSIDPGNKPPFDADSSANWTHDVLLSDLADNIITLNSVSYYEFLCDMNENISANGRYLSLDELQIYLSATGDASTMAFDGSGRLSGLGTLVYDMENGEGNWVALNAELTSGSGAGDIRLLVPVSMFNTAKTTGSLLIPDNQIYMYFYTKMGGSHTLLVGEEDNKGNPINVTRSDWLADATFEEWGERVGVGPTEPPPPPPPVPEATTLSMLGLGLAALMGLRRKK